MWRKIFAASETWMGTVAAILPLLPISEPTKKGLVVPIIAIWVYVSGRVTSKVAKAVFKPGL